MPAVANTNPRANDCWYNLIAIFLISCIGFAWMVPGSWASLLLGWTSCLAFCFYSKRLKKPYRTFYAASLLSHTLAFYWLFFTIRDFGGFPNIAALPIFLFFIAVSALQFPIFVFIKRNLPGSLNQLLIGSALAWSTSEALSIRIFPWLFGHTQIKFLSSVQIADIAGVELVSFLMFWVSDAIIDLGRKRQFRMKNTLPLIFLGLSVVYGNFRIAVFSGDAPEKDVVVVQANISLEEKNNQKMFKENSERYLKLSKENANDGALIIWPETVITDWIYAGIGNVKNDPRQRVPFIENSSILLGSLTYSSKEHMHNSALAVLPNGTVLQPYHKQILMPFGEYTPLSNIFPFLKDINSGVADFTPGSGEMIFNYPLGDNSNQWIKVAPLICYEDIVPSLSKRSTAIGANLLVSISNDAWFGNTVAPLQHHLIASFRAIENRRTFVRSTNTGFTAIVNAIGETQSSLPVYSEAVLKDKVKVFSARTFYNSYLADQFWKILGMIILLLALQHKLISRHSRRK